MTSAVEVGREEAVPLVVSRFFFMEAGAGKGADKVSRYPFS